MKEDDISARGATDDKGQLVTHEKAIESYLKFGEGAPLNVKFLLEGEEEVFSPNLTPFIKANLDMLKDDVCVISDSSMRTIEEPTITYSLRGMTYIEVEDRGPKGDPHGSFFGGATHNPANARSQITAKFFNEDNSIAVPGFYDDVEPLRQDEREMIARSELTEDQFKPATGLPAVWDNENFTIGDRVSARPMLDVNGLWSGYSGPGPKTIIPGVAGAKISSRLVANQDPQKIFELIRLYIKSITPPTITVEVTPLTTRQPALIPFDIAEMQAAARTYEKGWEGTSIFARGSGSIPVVANVVDLMKIPVVMMGYGLGSDVLHAPNVHYSIEMFERGIETAIVFREELAALSR